MQGFNRYYPTDFDPKEHDTLNAYHGKHALGDRARKLPKGGGLIVRFELPIDIVCLGCNNYIGQGVRYNAEKVKTGNYYTTPIWTFKCKCHLCSNWFSIRTDPKNTAYVVVEGAREKVVDWVDDDTYHPAGLDRDRSGEEEKDAFASLETSVQQKQAVLSTAQRLEALEEQQNNNWSDPYTLSRKLRAQLRKDKKILRENEKDRSALVERLGLGEDVERELNNLEGEFKQETEEEALDRRIAEAKEWEDGRLDAGFSELDEARKEKRLRIELGHSSSLENPLSKKPKAFVQSSSSSSSKAKLPPRSLEASKKKRSFSSTSPSTKVSEKNHQVKTLASKLLLRNAHKSDPFLNSKSTLSSSPSSLPSKSKSKGKDNMVKFSRPVSASKPSSSKKALVEYGSE